ncbi:hypothetical protein MNBD_GAMMA22-1388 [hydrothermal vent metagenome]|uniref:Uncharacterized protein n=1 Tax=hydrothermal vent metagenome TaxID=652676 RepID=A0A3B1ABS7_9ZZZZ
MPTPFEPNVGQCYRDQQGRSFEVVALDELDVEIQYQDGEVDEFDIDTWYLLNVNPADVTTDWSCSSVDIAKEDSNTESANFDINDFESEDLFEEI